jgi:multimeric flavodoxin WrbA
MILGICGSPRKQATDYALKEALHKIEEEGYETSFFTVLGKKISPCFHCDYCVKNEGECANKDDMLELYDLIREADGIIIASPMHNGGISAQTKIIMDRCRALIAKDYDALRGKIGMGICVAGDRNGGQELGLQEIHTFYILNGIIPVSGGSFGSNLGATLWSQDTLEGLKKDGEGLRVLNRTIDMFLRYMEVYNPKIHPKP